MKMAEHIRRFSMPPPGFTMANSGVAQATSRSPQKAQATPLTTLAQIYADARQQAQLTVQRRQWDALCDRLFNS
jgi:hypothetical protein